MSDHQFFMAYFSYLCLKNIEEIDFGFAKVWNFSKKKDAYIQDADLKERVSAILNANKSVDGSDIINEAAIISIGDIDFRVFTEEDLKKVKLIKYILFLSYLSKNNMSIEDSSSGHRMATAENFDVIFQNFTLGSDHISLQAGEIVNLRKGGYRLNDVEFRKPDFIPTPSMFGLDDDLFNGLLKLEISNLREFTKIMSAAEIFFQSFYNSPYVSRNSRVLLQLSAFEILLDLPEEGQRKFFKEAVKKYAVLVEDGLFSHLSRRRGGRVETEQLTMKEIWADVFYCLRNDIIHGNNPSNSDFMFKQQRHTDISVLFFIFIIKKQIEGFLADFPCDFEIKWKSWEEIDSGPSPIYKEEFRYTYNPRRILEREIAKQGLKNI